MSGVLYLIPNTLGDGDAAALASVLPDPVRAQAARLTYFVGENAKTTRAFLKRIGAERPIQEIEIRELNVQTPSSAIEGLLAEHGEGLASADRHRYIDVVIAQQFTNTKLLSRIVFHNQQPLSPRDGVFLDAGQRRP